MKRTALKRNKPLKNKRKPPKAPVPRSEVPLEELPRKLWGEAAQRMRCAICGSRRRVQGHHVVSKRWLKANGYAYLLWDSRNRLPLCSDCHEYHENASRRVPREKLRPSHHDFIAEVGLGHWPDWFQRNYPDGQA